MSAAVDPWYLLYDGQSIDGYGRPKYCGRTVSKDVAKAHFDKIKSNPYSIGHVLIAEDKNERIAEECDFSEAISGWLIIRSGDMSGGKQR